MHSVAEVTDATSLREAQIALHGEAVARERASVAMGRKDHEFESAGGAS